jgi:DNA-binding transcriptional ArsR family regulator
MTDHLSAVFGALADPTRRAILARLADGDLTVAELSAPFSVSQPAISRHLKVLEGAGLVSRSRRATARPSHLEAEPLQEATDWLARYQEFWDESHDRLDTLLASLQGDQATQPPRGGQPRRNAP